MADMDFIVPGFKAFVDGRTSRLELPEPTSPRLALEDLLDGMSPEEDALERSSPQEYNKQVNGEL